MKRYILSVIVLHLILSSIHAAADTNACNSTLTNDLRNDQFSASSVYDPTHNASAARLSGEGWSASTSGDTEYLQVDLEGLWEITRLAVQGSSVGWYTKSFRVFYSNDALVWTAYNSHLSRDLLGQIFVRNGTTVQFEPAIQTRYLTINPVKSIGYSSLRIELYGCKRSETPNVGVSTIIVNDIEDNTVWIPSQSPIVIDRQISIRPTGSLTIQAGVSIVFMTREAGLNIFGTLTATGIAGLNTLFTSNQPVLTTKSLWRGLQLESGGFASFDETVIRQAKFGIQGNSSSVNITRCTIYGCTNGVRLSGGTAFNYTEQTEIQQEHFVISYSKLLYNTDALSMHGHNDKPYFYIRNTYFNSNSRYGILFENWDIFESSNLATVLFLTDSHFDNNLDSGIQSYQHNILNNLMVKNSSFKGNNRYGIHSSLRYADTSRGNHFSILGSEFVGNGNAGMYVYCVYCSTSATLTLDTNYFEGPRGYAVDFTHIYPRDASYISVDISKNTFAKHTLNNYAIKLQSTNTDNFNVNKNVFNDVQGGVEILGTGTSIPEVNVTGNTFNNIFGSTKYVMHASGVRLRFTENAITNSSSSVLIDISDGFRHVVNNNTFINNTNASCYVRIGQEFDRNESAVADYNYWGTAQIMEVKSKICDFFIDSTKARLHIGYFYSNISKESADQVSAAVDFQYDYDITTNAYVVGGIISSSTNSSRWNVDAILVNRSIIIEETADVHIFAIKVNFTQKRGIAIFGNLRIGSIVGAKTVLQSHKSSEKWSGIYVHSAEISITNSDIQGVDLLLDIKTGCDVTINATQIDNTGNAIKAFNHNGYLNINIYNTTIRTRSDLSYIRMNDTSHINISIADSEIKSSSGKVIYIDEARSQGNLSRINVNISDTKTSGYGGVAFIYSCSSHLTANILSSGFNIGEGSGTAIDMRTQSVDVTVSASEFERTSTAVYLRFCNPLFENVNVSRRVNISTNRFASSINGQDIHIYRHYTSELKHVFYINNNLFSPVNNPNRIGIKLLDYGYYGSTGAHSFFIEGNTFSRIKNYAIQSYGPADDFIITNNTFFNNTVCIEANMRDFMFQNFSITNNTFEINNADGIIKLLQPRKAVAVIDFERNTFINNTGTVLTFASPNITIIYNLFKNKDAQYNVKVLQDSTAYIDEVVNASLNFWSSTDVNAIAKQIYDKDYDQSLLDIVFRPYLGSDNYSDIQNEDAAFMSDSGEIGGSVNGKVILKTDKSPYDVVSNIEVGVNDTLTLEAGVSLQFKENLGITVFGTLNVTGQVDFPVVMVSKDVKKAWKGIDIRPAVYIGSSSLRYVVVNNTLEGIKVADGHTAMHNVTSTFSETNGFTIVIHNATLASFNVSFSEIGSYNNTKSGLVLDLIGEPADKTTLKIDGCAVYGNQEHGISVMANGTVVFTDCTLYENRLSGVYISQNKGGETHIYSSSIANNFEYAINAYLTDEIILKSSNVTNHTFGYFNYWGTWYTRPFILLKRQNLINKLNIVFENNTFSNNTADGIEVRLDRNSEGILSIRLENNTFTGGNRTFFINDVSYYTNNDNMAHITVLGNNFTENRNTQGPLINIKVENVESIDIDNNVIEHNEAESGIVISGNTKRSNGGVTIQHNVFVDNVIARTSMDMQTYNTLRLVKNVFDNLTPCELTAPVFESSYQINATLNYWGGNIGKEVVDRVCGFEKDMSRSFVHYIPYYLNVELNQIQAVYQFDFDVSGAFGGEITKDVTLAKTDYPEPVIISRSIFVRNGSSLSVTAGMRLLFAQNRGIYVAGVLNLDGGDNGYSGIELENSTLSTIWYGIALNSSSAGNSTISNTRITNTVRGIDVYSPYFDIKGSTIINSSSSCLKFGLGKRKAYDFGGTYIYNCSTYGLSLYGSGSVEISNIFIKNATTGISVLTNSGDIAIKSSNISNSSWIAMDIQFSDTTYSGNFSMDNCIVSNSTRGVSISTRNYLTYNRIYIQRNRFENISMQTLTVNAAAYQYYSASDRMYTRNVDIGYNTFTNACDIYLTSWNNVNLTFHDNVMKNSNCTGTGTCYFHAYANGNRKIANLEYDISTNVFENLKSDCIVQLRTSAVDIYRRDIFFYNQLLSNQASTGVVVVDSKYFNLSQNIFDNPKSAFDVSVERKGSGIINATNNWWGTADEVLASKRVLDSRRDITLLSLQITPIMVDPSIDCSGVNNCSSQGECVSPNRCRCYSGWTGTTCTQFDCAGVNSCYGNGVCTAPNTCQCNAGWSGKGCIIASCRNVGDCSGHGVCILPDVCTCAEKFTGANCSSCVTLHWGPLCQTCPDCQHGKCNLQTGVCDCESENWTGYLCDKCSYAYYGPNCLPLMVALSIVPNQGIDKGGNLVHVWGHNFPQPTNGTRYHCKFDTVVVNGMWEAWNHVVCLAPQHTQGDITLEVSPDGLSYTNNKLVYSFYATCPPGACGRDFVPPRGNCLFGGCSCTLPWTGVDCSLELLAPVIQTPEAVQSVAESNSYVYQLVLLQGNLTIGWILNNGPRDMSIDERTGFVEWRHAFATPTFYHIQVTAYNTIGSDTVTWQLVVPVSYSATVTSIEPSGVLPAPRSIQIYGEISFSNSVHARVVPVDIRIISNFTGRSTTLSELTNPLQPTSFSAAYFPRPDDTGMFSVTANHPADIPNTNHTITWYVMGMRCEPSRVQLQEYIESDTVVIKNVSSLVNTGGHVISSISSTIDGIENAYVKKSTDGAMVQPFLQEFRTDDHVMFDLIIPKATPLSGRIFVIFTSQSGTSARLQVDIQLLIRKPLLVFNPSSVKENIIRGTQKILDVEVTNKGTVTAENVEIELPNDDRLSLVSFSNVDNSNANATVTNDSADGFIIPPGGSAVMTLSVTFAPSASLGEMSGSIAVNTELTTASIAYRFFITSIQKMNLTFVVKDEYTYFASDSPLVSGAEVRLDNPRRGYSEVRYTTNETGYVVFEGVFEDQYTLYAQADGHSTYSAIILATPDKMQYDIFLQRVAVKYTWTVTPTTVEDVYKITLDSTFETLVPMPVVTIEPAKVNTIPYELKEDDIIEFTLTNHGLIRADHLRFSLPTGHPYLNFESTIDTIGSLEANSSIIVPVKATLKSRRKRNVAALAICGLALLYDYDCGGTQTRDLGVTLTREYPGRPPLPCGLIGSGSSGSGTTGGGVSYTGGGRHSASGSSMAYNPVTPLSCDCAKTLIKSCALAYHPIAGCAIAVTDLGTAVPRGDGDAVLVTLNIISGIADTAFACVIGVAYPGAGLLYTTIRCVIDAAFKCDSGRRRRDVSSEIVNNMITTAKPIDNFYNMISEILGNEEMNTLETAWYPAFKKAISDDSDDDNRLSADEFSAVLNTLSDKASTQILSNFLYRWNDTASAWKNGTLNELTKTGRVINVSSLGPQVGQYLRDIKSANASGFGSIFDEFEHATDVYKTAEKEGASSSVGGKDDNVCAKVRVRIVQELVLTRDAFNARLEIENGENSALENLKVDVHIKETYGDGAMANDKFSIGSPNLQGISGVDGTGQLGKDLSGSAEWLIIPYATAAPKDDTQYDVGGSLSYSIGGSDFFVLLLPDTITVKPNPSLVVHYFHEKYVRGDDPLTSEVEPIVPFSLAVMVMNDGYGVARALKISSAQPEIIENDKGLLITFKIIGAQLGNSAMTPSLTVDFGDISSFETKTAKWQLTSTLKGTFYNYSATFENINPLGDPQLSLLDKLGYHELIHLVRIDTSYANDGLDDFLVNDYVDSNGMPDKLYNSANGTDIYDVVLANVTYLSAIKLYRQSKEYTIVTIRVSTNSSQWYYLRIENNFTSPNTPLLHAMRGLKDLLLDKNVWQTTHILDSFFLHILDFIEDNSSDTTVVEQQYFLTYGPKNIYAPQFNATSYSKVISMNTKVGTSVLKIDTFDRDEDEIYHAIEDTTIDLFDIDSSSGVISVANVIADTGEVHFNVVASDFGYPPKSSTTFVSINVVGDSNSTPSSTLSTTTMATESIPTTSSDSTTYKTTTQSTITSTPPTITSTSVTTSSFVSDSTVTVTTQSTSPSNVTNTSTGETSRSDGITSSSKATTKYSTPSVTQAVSTTPSNGTREEMEGDFPYWAIPTAVGIVLFLLIVVFVAVFVYAIRKKANGVFRGDSSYRMGQ